MLKKVTFYDLSTFLYLLGKMYSSEIVCFLDKELVEISWVITIPYLFAKVQQQEIYRESLNDTE